MKHCGASIIFHNSSDQVLLVLRDSLPTIPCPGMWDLPGGHIEHHETAEACIVREMLEEIEVNVEGCKLFRVYEFSDRTEHVFFKLADFDLQNIVLHEGQMLRWFSRAEAEQENLAYGFNQVLSDYFNNLPGTIRKAKQ
jgi:8-oxo-dGTP diphosphatase